MNPFSHFFGLDDLGTFDFELKNTEILVWLPVILFVFIFVFLLRFNSHSLWSVDFLNTDDSAQSES